MCESEMMVYRGLPPRGKTWEWVVIDDHAIAAVTPKGASGARARSTRRARELFSAGRTAYESIGIEDVAEKRKEGQLTAVAWGCEVQGRRGRAGSKRAKRAALAALTLDLVTLGCTTVEVLQSVVGLWSDVLLYRREAYAVFGARTVQGRFAANNSHLARSRTERPAGGRLLGAAPGLPVARDGRAGVTRIGRLP